MKTDRRPLPAISTASSTRGQRQRFLVTHPRWEPGAVAAPRREFLRAGGGPVIVRPLYVARLLRPNESYCAERRGKRRASCVPLANEPPSGWIRPRFPTPLFKLDGLSPGTRVCVKSCVQGRRSGARAEETRWKEKTVSDGLIVIDVSKNHST